MRHIEALETKHFVHNFLGNSADKQKRRLSYMIKR